MDDLLTRAARAVSRRVVRNDAPVPFSSPAQSSSVLWGGNDSSISGIAQAAYDAHGAVGTLFAIVAQVTWAVAETEWHLYRRTSVRDKSRRQEVLNHPFMYVWEKPNAFYTGDLFRETVQQHLELVGEGIIVLNKVDNLPIEMWAVRPDRMTPVKHPRKYLTGWMYRAPDGEEVPLTLDQVIQLKYPNPGDPYRGRGPVQTVLADIDSSRYSAEWNRNFFINGAQPGGIIEIDYRMDEDEYNKFVQRWREQHRGVANAHRVAVLENAKWTSTNYTMQDMQFAELRNLPRELIREAFAFPKPMLGTVDDVNRANSEAAKEIMAEGHTIPRLKRWKSVVNAQLLPQFANGATLELDFDDPTPINHEAADRARTSSSKGAAELVKAGYHPDDVSDAMSLPRMRWVGIPQGASATGDTGASV